MEPTEPYNRIHFGTSTPKFCCAHRTSGNIRISVTNRTIRSHINSKRPKTSNFWNLAVIQLIVQNSQTTRTLRTNSVSILARSSHRQLRPDATLYLFSQNLQFGVYFSNRMKYIDKIETNSIKSS